MERRGGMGVAAVLLLLASAAGCEDPTDPLDGASFGFDDDRIVMDPGGTLTPAFHGVDGDGEALDAGIVTWSSSDPTTASVDRGLVTAHQPGVVLIRGQAGASRDSVRVRVRMTDLGDNEVAARAQGSSEAESGRFAGAAFLSESIVGQFETHSLILPSSGEVDPRERFQALIRIPGWPSVGARTLDVFEVEELGGRPVLLGQEGVALYRLQSVDPVRWELWVGVGSPELEIEQVEYPAGPGLAIGRIRGNVSLEAAGLLVEGVGEDQEIVGQVSDVTVRYYMEFDVPLQHSVSGGGTVEPGGRLGGLSVNGSGISFLHDGALATELAWVTPPPDPTAPVQYAGRVETWTPDPGVGSLDVPRSGVEILGPAGYEASVPWMRASFHRIENLRAGPEEWAVVTEGAITLTRYDAPTVLLTGRVEGSFQATLEVWADEAPTGELVPFAGTFILPVYPEGWRNGRAASPSGS